MEIALSLDVKLSKKNYFKYVKLNWEKSINVITARVRF